MSDHSTEAGVQPPGHPSYRDGGKEAVSVFGVIILVAFIYWVGDTRTWPSSPTVFWMATVVVALGTALIVARLIGRIYASKDPDRHALREADQAATEKRIAEAKARGDFDRWSK